jgi:tetratricopeptide (TPR) repeat protein
MTAYADARALYQQGRYRDAVKRLEEARVLDPAAKELPYNLALVHEKLGELDDAVRYMTMYAAMETDPVEKERAEKAVERLEGARKDLAAHEEKPPAPPPPPEETAAPPAVIAPPPPPPAPRGKLDKWTIGTAGLSVVALGAGTFFGVSALRQSPNDPTTSPGGTTVGQLREDASEAHRNATMADVGFGVAIAAGAAAIILYFTRRDTRRDTGAGHSGNPGHAAASARGLEVQF